jgi:small-conductance mechanosensitive channel
MGDFYIITINTLLNLWQKFLAVAPKIVVAIVVFLIGLLIAAILARLIRRIFEALLVDKFLGKFGLTKATNKAGLKLNSGKFLGELIRWLVIIVFLMALADMLNLTGLSEFLGSVVLYIPNIVIAVLILFSGTVFAYFIERLVSRSLKVAGYDHYSFISGIAKWSIIIFAILAALSQLGVAQEMVEILFTGIVAMITIAGGLALGLGGQDVAKDILEKVKKDFQERK